MLIASSPASIMPARDLVGDQRAVADHPDFADALLFRVANLLGQLAVHEGLAVVVHRTWVMPSSTHSSTIFLNRSNDITPCVRCISSRGQNTHFALQMLVLSIWTISGRIGDAIAAGREQQPAQRLGVAAQHVLDAHRARAP